MAEPSFSSRTHSPFFLQDAGGTRDDFASKYYNPTDANAGPSPKTFGQSGAISRPEETELCRCGTHLDRRNPPMSALLQLVDISRGHLFPRWELPRIGGSHEEGGTGIFFARSRPIHACDGLHFAWSFRLGAARGRAPDQKGTRKRALLLLAF